MILASGLTGNKINFCCLNQNHEAATHFKIAAKLSNSVVEAITIELESVRKDIRYWTSFANSSEVLVRTFNTYIAIYRQLKDLNVSFLSNPLASQGEVTIGEYIQRLRKQENALARKLAVVYDACCKLKLVYVSLLGKDYDVEESKAQAEKNSAHCLSEVQSCLTLIVEQFPNLTPKVGEPSLTMNRKSSIESIAYYITSSPRKQPALESSLKVSNSALAGLMAQMEGLVAGFNSNTDGYPLQSIEQSLRRPTLREIYWLPSCVAAGVTLLAAHKTYSMYHDGSLHKLAASLVTLITKNFQEHIVEPVDDLLRELFDTMRRRKDAIVTREDLQQSKVALQRMLDDFCKSHKGHHLLGKGEGPDTPSSDAVMEALMRSYEAEMKNPIQGVVFGNLMTSMLIQMQKLKVHTENALLTMDQVLASNQLTMACTGAMPAIALFGFIGYRLYRWFLPAAPKPGLATRKLRLLMSDVERSLERVSHLTSSSSNASNTLAASSSRLILGHSSDSINYSASPHKMDRDPIVGTFRSPSRVGDEAGDEAGDDSSFHLQLEVPHSPLLHVDIDTMGSASESQKLHLEPAVVDEKQAKLLVARGLLCFHLTRFRHCMEKLFSTDYWKAPTSKSLVAFHMYLTWGSFLEGEGSSELSSVSKDLQLLLSPEEEVSIERKLQTARRMRVSYECLVAPMK